MPLVVRLNQSGKAKVCLYVVTLMLEKTREKSLLDGLESLHPVSVALSPKANSIRNARKCDLGIAYYRRYYHPI